MSEQDLAGVHDEEPSIRCKVRRNLGATGRCILLKNHGGEHSYEAADRCFSRGPDGILCQHDGNHLGQHQLGSVYWG